MRPDEVSAITRACRRIDGWFSPDAAQLFGLLDQAQRDADVTADLFEIGVHHGKSAVLICHMAREGERVKVCDLFGTQADNVSGSGMGDRAVFERNIAALAPPGRRAEVFEKRSDLLTPAEIGSAYRIFHVDGGHLVEEALADLRLGAAVLDERGVLIVDDPFRAEWPGVAEAVVRFLDERDDLTPVAVGFNKLVICPRRARPIYERALTEPWDYIDPRVWTAKELPFAGSTVRIFSIPPYRQIQGAERWTARARWLEIALRERLARLLRAR